MNDRSEKIQNVRDLLTFIEDNPEIPLPYFGQFNSFAYDEEEMDTLARAMAPCKKRFDDTYFALEREFGTVTLSVNFSRDEVCERIVVGTEDIPAHTIAAYTKEIVEWKCPDGVLRQS
jgi:hypothetical protein